MSAWASTTRSSKLLLTRSTRPPSQPATSGSQSPSSSHRMRCLETSILGTARKCRAAFGRPPLPHHAKLIRGRPHLRQEKVEAGHSCPSAPITTFARIMKVLFLDVDGVLTIPDGSGRLDEVKLRRLESIVNRTGSSICISSNCESPTPIMPHMRTSIEPPARSRVCRAFVSAA